MGMQQGRTGTSNPYELTLTQMQMEVTENETLNRVPPMNRHRLHKMIFIPQSNSWKWSVSCTTAASGKLTAEWKHF